MAGVVQLPPWPSLDFSEFGEVEVKKLSRIQKLTAGFLTRNWVSIPHVTHHDDADVTDMEALRKDLGQEKGIKISALAFIVKALATALGDFPHFNASLGADGETVTYKRFVHIGVAVDTPQGLLVPVLRDCDRKSLEDIATEITEVSGRARSKGLSLQEMSGGSMTVSSLGGIGGTAFTPIINAPEVAILGVTRSVWKPVREEGGGLAWRLMVPLSLSYDHRIINGADAARFLVRMGDLLGRPGALLGAQ